MVANLNDQIEAVQQDCSLVLNGHIIQYMVCFTGDGALMMAAAQTTTRHSCWVCTDPQNLQHDNSIPTLSYCTPLFSTIPPHCRVGDYLHCFARICSTVWTRLLHHINTLPDTAPSIRIQGRNSLLAIAQSIRSTAQHCPADRKYPQHVHGTLTMDLTEAKVFLRDQTYIREVFHALHESLPDITAPH